MSKPIMYFLVLALAVVILIGALFFSGQQPPLLNSDFYFQDTVHNIMLTPYFDTEDEKYYLFLPGYSDPGNISLAYSDSGIRAVLSDGSQEFTDNLSGIPMNQDLTLNIIPNHPPIPQSYTIQFRQCSGLPSLFIETQSGSIGYVNEDKGNSENVAVTIVDGDGSLLLSQTASIYGRGNGTWWNQAKRPYNLKFSHNVNVGPFTNLSTLCLFAEYSDESKLRNSLAYYAGQELEIPYASPYMYTNVYIDGDYAGLYGIATKKEYTKHLREDNIQAVFELCGLNGKETFHSGFYGAPISVMHGSAAAVESVVNQFESAIFYQNWDACQEHMDMESLALKYTLDEFLGNFDMNYASQYYYLDENEVIHCMLPWDYDFSMGSNICYFNNNADISILGYRSEFWYSWYPSLLSLPAFQSQITSILKERFTDEFLAGLETHISESIAQISASRDCDLLRWKTSPPYNPNDYRSGLTELPEFAELFRSYFPKRRAFLLDYFENTEDYVCVSFTNGLYGNICIPRNAKLWDHLEGSALLTWEDPDSTFLGWYTEDGRTPEDIDIVTEDISFTAMYESLPLQEDGPAEVQETTIQKLNKHRAELTILVLFGAAAIILFLSWLRQLKFHGRLRQ